LGASVLVSPPPQLASVNAVTASAETSPLPIQNLFIVESLLENQKS
jgi:hypothetical protein